MRETFNWYAVYTKPRWEKKVAELFTRKDIENYCPLNRVHKQWSDRRKVVLEPLFTSYVFVRISPLDQLLVRQTEGVLNFVYWLSKPAIVRDEEIELIKRFLNEHDNVRVEMNKVNVNDKVRVVNGPLMLREGSVMEVKHKTIKVSLPTLGYTLVAEIEKKNVELIDSYKVGDHHLVS